jgi:hypothetical protein
MTDQEQNLLDALTGRAAILNLSARHNRSYSDRDRDSWIATFRQSGARYTRDGEVFTNLRTAFATFERGHQQRLVSVDHDISVDGVNATQQCVALLFAADDYGVTTLRATGTYRDELIYERGGWYFTSRELQWDSEPRQHRLTM